MKISAIIYIFIFILRKYDNFYFPAVLVSKNLTLYTLNSLLFSLYKLCTLFKSYITLELTYNFISEGECGTIPYVHRTVCARIAIFVMRLQHALAMRLQHCL